MIDMCRSGLHRGARLGLGLLLLTLAGPRISRAQSVSPCDSITVPTPFPRIRICAFAGAYRDSSLLEPRRCIGSFTGPLPDSIEARPRTITVRFRRDRRIEARKEFGGYRLYRVTNFSGATDTSRMVLIRRFSRQTGDERTWNFSVVDTATLQFKCRSQIVNDSVVTFIDPDSNGNFVKVCRLREPQEGTEGLCRSQGDSVFVLKAPPGPHDGFRTWYSITYEAKNISLDGNYADMFVPDLANCANPSDPSSCPNLNNKLLNLTAIPVEPTGGPTTNLERVVVVPNPYRGRAQWDLQGNHELHFINLPQDSRIKIYTVAGDLVAELHHNDRIRDFERWNLKNQSGVEVASGIYMYRVEASSFTFQDRFIVIR